MLNLISGVVDGSCGTRVAGLLNDDGVVVVVVVVARDDYGVDVEAGTDE